MSMADRDGHIWYDGKLVPWRNATTHVLTHTLHYGMGVFEGVRAYKTANGTAIFRLREHTDRLFRSAHINGMKIPYDKQTLIEAQKEVVRANELDSCYIRPLAFYGSGSMGVSPRESACTSRSPRGRGARTSARTRSRKAYASRLPPTPAIT